MSVLEVASLARANFDEHLELSEVFINDQSLMKTCLFSNVHHDDHNKIYIFPVIEKCLKKVVQHQKNGLIYDEKVIENYCQLACEFVLGRNSKVIRGNRCFGVQTTSSVGALRLGAQFLFEKLAYTTYCTVYPDCRGIYNSVFKAAGFVQGFTLRMPTNGNTSFKYFFSDLERVPNRSILVIGICGLNSTGVDPSMLEWYRLITIIERKNLFPFLDATFQGLLSGDVDVDAYPARYLVEHGCEFFIAQDFSFNMGLVSESPGNLCVVLKSASTLKNTKAILSEYMRAATPRAPVLGAHIVATVLGDVNIRDEFRQNLKKVVLMNENMRNSFMCNMRGLYPTYDWDKYENQRGLYLDIELNTPQIERLRNEHRIYVRNGGWICLAGLSNTNMGFVCSKISHAKKSEDKNVSSEEPLEIKRGGRRPRSIKHRIHNIGKVFVKKQLKLYF